MNANTYCDSMLAKPRSDLITNASPNAPKQVTPQPKNTTTTIGYDERRAMQDKLNSTMSDYNDISGVDELHSFRFKIALILLTFALLLIADIASAEISRSVAGSMLGLNGVFEETISWATVIFGATSVAMLALYSQLSSLYDFSSPDMMMVDRKDSIIDAINSLDDKILHSEDFECVVALKSKLEAYAKLDARDTETALWVLMEHTKEIKAILAKR